jgi:AcrR family transcriptional regulator
MWSDNASATGAGAAALTRTQRARRADVVAAAIAVIDREGYAAASIERIARAAATNKSTVLYHFKTKEAINEAVVRLLYDNGAAYMAECITAVAAPRDRLPAYLSSNLRFIAENAAHVNAVHRILENSGFDIAAVTAAADAVPWLRRLLTAGQEAGEFGAFDPEVMALAVRAVVDAASYHFTAHPDLDIDHYIDQAVQLFAKATAP